MMMPNPLSFSQLLYTSSPSLLWTPRLCMQSGTVYILPSTVSSMPFLEFPDYDFSFRPRAMALSATDI